MIDYKEFNAKKSEAYATKTKEEWEQWQASFKEYWSGLEFVSEEQRQNLLKQITELKERKEAWFEKQGNRPTVIRNSYIFQDELAAALTEYIKALTKKLNA